jgi:hypothetical protein
VHAKRFPKEPIVEKKSQDYSGFLLALDLIAQDLRTETEARMLIKETDAMRVLSIGRRLTIPDVKTESAMLAPLIEAEMGRAGMMPAGPWIFIANDLPKNAKTPFDWRICRPVTGGKDYRGALDLIELEPIMVASTLHQGPMRSLFTQGYAPLVAKIEMSRHNFSGESREIYHRWAGQGARYHEIEIQFGLAN